MSKLTHAHTYPIENHKPFQELVWDSLMSWHGSHSLLWSCKKEESRIFLISNHICVVHHYLFVWLTEGKMYHFSYTILFCLSQVQSLR